MFQETIDYAGDTDVPAIRLVWNQATDASNNKVYLYSSFTCPIKFINHGWILQSIHLQDHPSLSSLCYLTFFKLQIFTQARKQVKTSHHQMAEHRFGHFLTQYLEEQMKVVYYFFSGCKKSCIRIKVSCLLVEITRTDVSKTLLVSSILMPTKHKSHFGMHLQPLHTIDDVNARFLHQLGCSQIIFFVKASLQFYEYRHLLTILSCCYQGVDNLRIQRYAILGNHDFRY